MPPNKAFIQNNIVVEREEENMEEGGVVTKSSNKSDLIMQLLFIAPTDNRAYERLN